MKQKWLRAVSKSPASHSLELAIVYIPQEEVAIAVVVAEVSAAAVVEVVPEPMSREKQFSMLIRKLAADFKASQEMLILSTSNLVLVEAQESLTRRREVMAAVTGAENQIAISREVKSMMAFQRDQLHQRLQLPILLQPTNQWKPRLRKRKKLLKKKKSSLVLASTTS
jgi:hypothetical protein